VLSPYLTDPSRNVFNGWRSARCRNFSQLSLHVCINGLALVGPGCARVRPGASCCLTSAGLSTHTDQSRFHQLQQACSACGFCSRFNCAVARRDWPTGGCPSCQVAASLARLQAAFTVSLPHSPVYASPDGLPAPPFCRTPEHSCVSLVSTFWKG